MVNRMMYEIPRAVGTRSTLLFGGCDGGQRPCVGHVGYVDLEPLLRLPPPLRGHLQQQADGPLLPLRRPRLLPVAMLLDISLNPE